MESKRQQVEAKTQEKGGGLFKTLLMVDRIKVKWGAEKPRKGIQVPRNQWKEFWRCWEPFLSLKSSINATNWKFVSIFPKSLWAPPCPKSSTSTNSSTSNNKKSSTNTKYFIIETSWTKRYLNKQLNTTPPWIKYPNIKYSDSNKFSWNK